MGEVSLCVVSQNHTAQNHQAQTLLRLVEVWPPINNLTNHKHREYKPRLIQYDQAKHTTKSNHVRDYILFLEDFVWNAQT